MYKPHQYGSISDFTAMGVANEFANNAFKNTFVSHKTLSEGSRAPHVRWQFHGSLNRDLGKFDFLERQFPSLSISFTWRYSLRLRQLDHSIQEQNPEDRFSNGIWSTSS